MTVARGRGDEHATKKRHLVQPPIALMKRLTKEPSLPDFARLSIKLREKDTRMISIIDVRCDGERVLPSQNGSIVHTPHEKVVVAAARADVPEAPEAALLQHALQLTVNGRAVADNRVDLTERGGGDGG